MANTYNYTRTTPRRTDWSKSQIGNILRQPQLLAWQKPNEQSVPDYIRRTPADYDESVMAENIRQSARRAEATGIKYKETDLHRERRHDLQDGAHKYDPIQHEEDEYWQKREDEEKRLKEAAEQQEAEDLRKKQMAAELLKIEDVKKLTGKSERNLLPSDFMIMQINDMIGSGVEKANMAYLSTISGKILQNDALIDLAQALKQDVDLRRQFDLLKLATEGSTNSNEIADLQRRMLAIGRQLEDPEHKRKVTAYKKMAIRKHLGWLDKLTRVLANFTNAFSNDPDLSAKAQRAEESAVERIYNASLINLAYSGKITRGHGLSSQETFYNELSDDEKYNIANEAIDNVVKIANAKNEELRNDYVNGIDFQQRAQKYWNVTLSYKTQEQLYQDASLLNPMYYLYVMPGTIGSSNSSPDQLIATGIQGVSAVAGAAMAPFTGGTSAAVTANVGTITSLPYQIRGALDENYAEAGDKYISNIRRILSDPNVCGAQGFKDIVEDLAVKSAAYWKSKGMSDKWISGHCDISTDAGLNNVIQDAVAGIPEIKSNDPRFKKALIDAKLGLEALRQADNMRTMASIPVQTMASLMPVAGVLNKAKSLTMKGLDRAAGKILGRELPVTIASDAAGNIAARTGSRSAARRATEEVAGKYKNGFRKKTASETWSSGYSVGADLADAAGLGYFGRIGAGTVTGSAAIGARLGKQLLGRRSREFVDNFTEQVMHKYQSVYDKLLPQSEFSRFALKYGLNYGKAQFVNAMSEGSEEGVQFINSLENYADKYGYDGMSFGDLLVNDIKQGGRVANAYLSLLGIGNSELKDNVEFWNNVKGGFALGGGHSGIIRLAGDTQGAFREYNTNQLLLNNAVLNREASAISRANNRGIVQAVVNGDAQYARNIINDMRAADRNRKDPNFSEDDYDTKLDEIDAIESAVNNKRIVGTLAAKGIKKGSYEFNTAIADIVNLQQQYTLNINQQRDISGQLTLLYSDKSLHDDIEKLVSQEYLSGFVGYADLTQGHQFDEETNFGYSPSGEVKGAEDTGVGYNPNPAIRESHAQLGRAEYMNATKLANKLRALLLIKAKINTTNNWFDLLNNKFGLRTVRPDAKNILDNINKQILDIRSKLADAVYDTSFSDKKTTDAQLLTLLDGLDGVNVSNKNRDEIVEMEVANALLEADRAVTTKYLNQFSYGVVQSEDGKSYEYNPLEYKHQRKEQRRRSIAEMTGSEYTATPHTREKAISYEDDTYSKRIKAINEADERNAKLDWMVGDIYAGDAASKLADVDDNTIQSLVTQPLPTATPTSTTSNRNSLADRLGANRDKYLRNVAKAKKLYLDTVRKYKEWRRGVTTAMIFPFDDVVVKALAGVIRSAAIGVYKFDEFISDVKDIIESDDVQGLLPSLKYLYLKETARQLVKNPAIAGNFTSSEEVLSYQAHVEPEPELILNSVYKTVTDILEADDKNVIKDVSNWYYTFVNKDGKITIYEQYRFDDFEMYPAKNNMFYQHIVDTLSKAKTKEEFADALDNIQETYKDNTTYKLNFASYKPYFGVDGVNEAIATSFIRSNRPQSVQNGLIVRDALVNYFVTDDESLLQNALLVNTGNTNLVDLTLFVERAKQLKRSFDLVGLRAVKTNQIIYGTVDGKNVASQADVVLVSEEGDVYVYDVATSDSPINENLNQKIGTLGVNRYLRYAATNAGVVLILQSKLQYKIKSCNVLPIVIDRSSNKLVFEPTINIAMKDINAKFYPETNDTTEVQKQLDDVIAEYNSVVDEYNLLLLQHSEITLYTQISNDNSYTVADVSLAKNAISSYSQRISEIKDRISDINNKIQQELTSQDYSIYEQEYYDAVLEDEASLSDDMNKLVHDCSVLDGLLHELTIPTTEAERAVVDDVQTALYNAMISLNTVLINPDLNTTDVHQECLLMMSAAEQLKSIGSSFKYPALSMFVLEFSELPSGNQVLGKGAQLSAAYNKIRTWNNVFERILNLEFTDLSNDLVSKAFYSTILNKYYKQLLEDVVRLNESVESDAAFLEGLLRVVNDGLELIKDFNYKYGSVDDSVFLYGVDSKVTLINRMPTSWQDSYGDVHMDVTPSPYSMNDGPNSKKFYYISNYTDLIAGDNHGLFEFDVRDGKLVLVCKYLGNEIVLDFTQPSGNTHGIENYEYYNDNVLPFVNKVNEMLKYANANPSAKIEMHLYRSIPSFVTTKDGSINNVSKFLMASKHNAHDMFTVGVTENDRIGVSNINKLQIGGGKSIFTGPNLEQFLFNMNDPVYKNYPCGTLMYVFDSGRNESENRYCAVPLINLRFSDKTASVLVRMLEWVVDPRTNKNTSSITFDNKQYSYDLVRGMLDLCLYMYDPQKRVSEKNILSNRVSIEGTIVNFGDTSYNLSQTQDGVRLGEYLKHIGYRLDVGSLNANLNDSTNPIIVRTKEKFLEDSNIQEIRLPVGITFTRDDFMHKNSNGSVGSTLLGHYFRNGIVGTNVEKYAVTYLHIDNVRLVDDNVNTQESSITQTVENAQQQKQESDRKAMLDLFSSLGSGGSLDMRGLAVARTDDEITLFIDSCNKYAERVLGKGVKFGFDIVDNKYASQMNQNERVLGMCTAATVELSKYAPETAPFHEAFHRILELYLTAEERNLFYSVWRSKFGTADTTERDVAEGLADMFTDYMLHKLDIKNNKGFRKLIPFFKHVGFNIGLLYKLRGSYTKFKSFYHAINQGKFANRPITKELNDRFERLFGEGLYYKIENYDTGETANLEQFSSSALIHQIADAITYIVLLQNAADMPVPRVQDISIDGRTPESLYENTRTKRLLDMLCGEGKPENELTLQNRLWREILKSETKSIKVGPKTDKNGNPVERKGYRFTYYPNFAAISGIISAHMLGVIKAHDADTKMMHDELETSNDTDDKAMQANIDRFDRAAYEFSKLDSANTRVKLFFATFPYCTWNKDTKRWELDLSRNEYGVPTYMPMAYVYNMVVDEFGDAQSPEELLGLMEKAKGNDAFHSRLYQKYKMLFDAQHKTAKGGEQVIDYDALNLLVNVFKFIKSQKIDATICKSERERDGNKVTRVVNSAYDKDAAMFPKQWSEFLLDGMTGVFDTIRDTNGHVKINQKYKNVKLYDRINRDIFTQAAAFLADVKLAFGSINNTVLIAGQTYYLDDPGAVMVIKTRVVDMLNLLGIQISTESLDFMLYKKYGNVTKNGVKSWLNNQGKSSSDNFILQLLTMYNSQTGRVNEDFEKYGYSRIGFVKELGDWQGAYNRLFNELMTNGMDLSKLYTISQNHAISTAVNSFNRRSENDPIFRAAMGFNYNLLDADAVKKGSIILKGIATDKDFSIGLHTYLGFRTDNRNDFGVKYSEEPEVEDFIGKCTLLQSGAVVPGTLADKGTWVYLTLDDKSGNLKIPGLSYISGERGELTVKDGPTISFVGKDAFLIPNNQVLDQMIEYAECELAAILKCIEDLKTMPEEQKTANYYASRKDGVEPNGTRFWHLCSITLPVYEKDRLVGTKVVNLNNPSKKSSQLVADAKENFFDKSIEERRLIMALTLWDLNKAMVQKSVDLGVIRRVDVGYEQNGVKESYATSDDYSLMNLSNVHLNEKQIDALQSYLLKQRKQVTDAPNGPKKSAQIAMIRSMAIAALLGDVNTRSIISELECERLFIGHPAFFKTKYKGDTIIDQCSDKQKRVGSLVSTGDDNVILPGMPTHYTCAECRDYEIESTADIAKDVRGMFYNSELRHAYIKYAQSELKQEPRTAEEQAFSMSQKSIEEALPKQVMDKIVANADKYSNSLLGVGGEINVADGASYITEGMCKNLLRMNGMFSEDMRKAFELLEDENSSWLDLKEAADLIYNKVAIVTTKYTAYGLRIHETTGIAVPYLNKFALFPLFKCNATGKLRYIYDEMKAQGIDNLLMTSAVKIGSLGAVSFNGSKLSGKFNAYKQPYVALRKQLKTDPEEGERCTMGTQMVKKSLSNLVLGRQNYKFAYTEGNLKTDQEPTLVSGVWLRDKFMFNVEKIREFGEKTLREQFYTDNRRDVDKLSKYLKGQLTSRDADTTVLRALDVVDKDGQKKLRLPMAATADSHWIESILISTTNKHVIDITTPGNSFVQRSVFGMEGEYNVKDGGIVGQTIYNGNKLQMVNEDGSMDAVISLDYFKNILPRDLSFNEARQWLLDNKIIGQNAKANTVGYRIPTQAQSSIHAIRFVDVVQATQATVILPEEFTKITGSDFDIDHLYLASYNYRKDESNKITTEFGEDKVEKYQNSLLDCMITLLKDVDNSFTELFKSIDNDTELVTNVAKKIKGSKSVQNTPYVYGGLWEQVTRRNDYITGKFGIGPFALNTPSHVLTSLYNVKFKSSDFTNNTKIGRLDNIFDDNYNYIDAWLSAFINAHVDIVKDPYISKLNVNKTTYNHLNLLTRSGYGDASVWFLCHPIIRKISEIENKFSSKFAKDLDYKMTKEEAMLDALTPIMGKLTDSDMDLLVDPKKEKKRAEVVNRVLKDGLDKLIKIASGETTTDAAFAKDVYLTWKILEPYSLALSNLVQYTKIDTRKQGNTFIDMYRYRLGYNDFAHPRVNSNGNAQSLFDIESVKNLVNGSWIEAKTKTAIELPLLILQNQTFYANNDFMKAVFDYATYFTDAKIPSADLLNKIGRAMETAVNSRFFSQWMKQQGIDAHSLFYGKWPVAKQLNLLRSRIQAGHAEYAHLKDNLLLKQLLVETKEDDYTYNGVSYKGIPFIRVSKNIDNSKVDSEALRQAWADLLDDINPKVRKFAQQLVAYAFVTSGSYNGWNKIFKYVPFEWRVGMSTESTVNGQSYGDFIESQLNDDNFFSEEMLYDIVSNNFLEYGMVKRDSEKDANGDTKYFSVNNPRNPESPNIIARAYDTDRIGDFRVPSFVAIRRLTKCPNLQMQYDLYMCVSDTVLPGKSQNPMEDPARGAFYIKMPTKGYHVKRGYDIYEYGIDCGITENKIDAVSIDELSAAAKQIRQYIDDVYTDDYVYGIDHLANSDSFSQILEDIYSDHTAIKPQTKQLFTEQNQPTQQTTSEPQKLATTEDNLAEQTEIALLALDLGISKEEAKRLYEKGKENRKKCKGE